MENVFEVKPRETLGTKAAAKNRSNGDVPGVIYGKENTSTHFLISERMLQEGLRNHEKLVKIQVGKDKPLDALIHGIQYEPVSGDVLHCDLHIVKLDEQIEVSVSLELLGVEISPGAAAGGTVEMVLHELPVSYLPHNIPEQLTIDASKMEVGETKLVSDIETGEGITILTEADSIVAVVHEPVDLEAETDVEESLKGLEAEPTVLTQKEDTDENEGAGE